MKKIDFLSQKMLLFDISSSRSPRFFLLGQKIVNRVFSSRLDHGEEDGIALMVISVRVEKITHIIEMEISYQKNNSRVLDRIHGE